MYTKIKIKTNQPKYKNTIKNIDTIIYKIST